MSFESRNAKIKEDDNLTPFIFPQEKITASNGKEELVEVLSSKYNMAYWRTYPEELKKKIGTSIDVDYGHGPMCIGEMVGINENGYPVVINCREKEEKREAEGDYRKAV